MPPTEEALRALVRLLARHAAREHIAGGNPRDTADLDINDKAVAAQLAEQWQAHGE